MRSSPTREGWVVVVMGEEGWVVAVTGAEGWVVVVMGEGWVVAVKGAQGSGNSRRPNNLLNSPK